MNRLKLIHLVYFALIIQFILVGYSDLILYFNHDAAGSLLRLIHDEAIILIIVFFAAHTMLNWNWIVFTARKFYRRGKEVKQGEVIEANYMPIG